MPHDHRELPTGAPTSVRYCEDCGKATIWFLTFGDATPGSSGTSYRWLCSGQDIPPPKT